MSPPADLRKKRLLFRSWHRGTRESDLILGRFAEAHLARFGAAQLDRYEALLECSDAEIFDWVAGRAPVPAPHDHEVTRLLLAFRPVTPCSEKPSPSKGGTENESGGEGSGGARPQ